MRALGPESQPSLVNFFSAIYGSIRIVNYANI